MLLILPKTSQDFSIGKLVRLQFNEYRVISIIDGFENGESTSYIIETLNGKHRAVINFIDNTYIIL